MKHVVLISLEIPDEAPASVKEELIKSFIDINEQVAAEARESFGGLINITVAGGLDVTPDNG